MAAATCRGNIQLLFVTKREVGALASVQTVIADSAAVGAEEQAAAPPSVLRGLIVRLKYAGSYHLLPVEQLVTAADGARGLAVASPEAQQPSALLRVQLSSASGTNPLADGQWEAVGKAEVEQLAALLQQRGQPLSVAEAAAAAWRKQAALQWHAAHGGQPPAEQQRHLPALLQQLQDEQAIAKVQQQVEPEQQQKPVGFTVQLHREVPAADGGAQPADGVQADNVQQRQPQPPQQQAQQAQQHATKGGTAAGPLPASGAAAPPAAAAADFLAGLERQLADATARSAGDGGLDATAAVVADIQQQLLALKQQLLSVQQHQQQQPVSAAPPGVHVSSSSGDQLSPYAGPALQGGHLRPSPPLPAWQLQPLGAFHPGPAHQPPPAAASPRQVRYGQPASPSRHHTSTTSLGRHAGRLPSRSPSPKRRRPWQEPLRGELPLVPVAVRHFKHGGFISWELVGQVMFVSGLPTCDGEHVHRRVVGHRLAAMIEGVGAAVTDVRISNGDERGDIAYVTVATARQAARSIETLQGAELMNGRRVFLRPFRTEVEGLRQRFPEAAAEATRALNDLAAQGPPPPMRGRSPPPMRGRSPPPFRGQSPPPGFGRSSPPPGLRGRSPPPAFRSHSPPPGFGHGSPPPGFRGRSPLPPSERGRKRARSGSRSLSRGRDGRWAARGASPDAILAPVLLNHFLQRGGQQEWALTGRQVFITGLEHSRDDAAIWQQLMPLVAAAGGTVTDRRVGGSDPRGPSVYLTLATAQEAAAVIECLQGVEVEGGRLYLRPVRHEVEDKCRQHPEAAAAGERALAAAAGRANGGRPRSRSPSGSRLGRAGGVPRRSRSPSGSRLGRRDVTRADQPPARRRSPEPARQPASKGCGGAGGSRDAQPSSDGSGSSAFWDPVYRLERRCLSLLQRTGPTTLSMLFGELGAVPPPCGPLNTALLRRFLDSRPHLFCIDRERAEAAEGASAVLRYKRELLQYLASHPPRVSPEQLESEVPPPSGLPRRLASEGALRFVRDVLWREVDIVSLPGERSEAAVELRPYPVKDKDECRAARAAGYEPPSFHQACRFFWHLNGTQAACMHGARCRFAHAAPREEFL